jgi:hypothetical protein
LQHLIQKAKLKKSDPIFKVIIDGAAIIDTVDCDSHRMDIDMSKDMGVADDVFSSYCRSQRAVRRRMRKWNKDNCGLSGEDYSAERRAYRQKLLKKYDDKFYNLKREIQKYDIKPYHFKKVLSDIGYGIANMQEDHKPCQKLYDCYTKLYVYCQLTAETLSICGLIPASNLRVKTSHLFICIYAFFIFNASE